MPENEQQEPATDAPPAPPWGSDDEFNPEKAWNLIQGLKADKDKLSNRTVLTDEQQHKLAEYDRLAEASKTDLERKTEEVTRWQSETARWQREAVAARVQAIASGDFADPSDAVAAITPESYLTAGGEIDEDGIRKALTEVLERKPHWRRHDAEPPPSPRAPLPNLSQGRQGAPPLDKGQQFAQFLNNL